MTPLAWLGIAIAAVFAGAIFSTVQFALRSVSRGSVEAMLARRRKPGGRSGGGNGAPGEPAVPGPIERILDDLAGHAAAVAVPRVVSNLVVGVAAVLWIAGLRGTGTVGAADAAIGVAMAGLVIWLFSVAIPLAIAEHAAEIVVIAFAWLARGTAFVLAPLRVVVAFNTEVVRRLAGETARDTAEAREAELLSLVEESEREGDLDESAREMIEAVVEFRSTTVEQIMTPRTEIQGIEYTDDLAAVKAAASAATHSRIPVYRETIDSVVGVLYLKDLLRWLIVSGSSGESFTLAEVLREATFVPETKTVRELLSELLDRKVHIAFATDEYGGIAGLVTIEDIIEEVFGEIRDEYEPEDTDEPQVVVDSGALSADIDARVEVDEANDELEQIGIQIPEHDDWDTVGGFVVTTMGRIPSVGDRLEHEGVIVEVLEAEPTRVVKVRVSRGEAATVG